MKKLLLLCACLTITSLSAAQVGIGTNSPSSELEIETTNTGIPALELNPQTAPSGNQTGQIAVIGDKLFMFDRSRGKWLSVEATAFTWTGDGNTDNEVLSLGSMTDFNSGSAMPLDGTIVYVAATSSGGVATKGFDIFVRNGLSIVSTNSFNLVGNSYSNSSWNVDVSAGDYVTVGAQAALGQVVNPTVTIWIKWRE